MNRRYSKFIRVIHFSGDILLLNFSFFVAFYLRFDHTDVFEQEKFSTQLLLFNFSWALIIYIYDTYAIYRISHVAKIIGTVINSIFSHLLITLALFIMLYQEDPSRLHWLYTYGIFSLLVIAWRTLMVLSLKRYRQLGKNFRQVIFAGYSEPAENIYYSMANNMEYGYRVLGFFDDSPEHNGHQDLIIGTMADVMPYCIENKVDEIFLSVNNMNRRMVKDLIQFADNHLIRTKIVPDFARLIHKRVKLDFFDDTPIMIIRGEPLEKRSNRVLKRAFDIAFSSFIIVFVLSWLYPLMAILIKRSSPGPVLFRQKRTGKNDEVFDCYKFRSMNVNDDADQEQARKNDPRITKIGQFMRKTNIDELPQFINVLLGNMTIVGPRPHMLKHTEEYAAIVDQYMVRHLVKPGITGWAQVRGFRGETKDIKQMEKRVKADISYLENWSFLFDLKIIARTILNTVKGEKNAY